MPFLHPKISQQKIVVSQHNAYFLREITEIMNGKAGDCLTIAICDDEELILRTLKEKTKRLFPEADIKTFSSGKALLAEKPLPDIVLLDIQMQGMNGMEAARSIREQRADTVLIFVTADASFVFEAFDVGAFHYLVKPFTDEKFAEVLKKAAAHCRSVAAKADGGRYITVFHKGTHTKIYVGEIVYAEVYNRKIAIHTTGQEIEYYGKLGELAKELGQDFFQTHRAYLVHLKYVTRYDANSVTLKKGKVLMSKANFPEFVKAYLKYNQRKAGEYHER